MKLADYKRVLKGHEARVSAAADTALQLDWRRGAVGALNTALGRLAIPGAEQCTNENTANAVLHWCDRKAGK